MLMKGALVGIAGILLAVAPYKVALGDETKATARFSISLEGASEQPPHRGEAKNPVYLTLVTADENGTEISSKETKEGWFCPKVAPGRYYLELREATLAWTAICYWAKTVEAHAGENRFPVKLKWSEVELSIKGTGFPKPDGLFELIVEGATEETKLLCWNRPTQDGEAMATNWALPFFKTGDYTLKVISTKGGAHLIAEKKFSVSEEEVASGKKAIVVEAPVRGE